MKQKINLRLIGIAVIAVLATAIGITFIYYGCLLYTSPSPRDRG